MPRADCSSNTIHDSISRVSPSLRGPRFAPALRHARRPCALPPPQDLVRSPVARARGMPNTPGAVPPYCDACRHTPSAESKARCTQKRSSCSSAPCNWLVQLNRTFAVQWGPGALGWGNSFSYVRNLHLFAALLGRRLLLHPVKSYLSMVILVVLARAPCTAAWAPEQR